METMWRLTNDGQISDGHALECLMWLGRLRPSQLAQLLDLPLPPTEAMLRRLAGEGLVTNDRQGHWQPSGQGRAYLSRWMGADVNRYATIPAQAPRLDLLTDALIAIIRQAMASGLDGVALLPLVSVEPQARWAATHVVALQLFQNQARRGERAIPWTRQAPWTASGPGQQLMALVVETLDARRQPAAILKHYARALVVGTGKAMVPVWVTDTLASRAAHAAALSQELGASVWVIADRDGLTQGQALICDQGTLRERRLFG